MDQQRSDPNGVSCLNGSDDSIAKECPSDPLPLPIFVDRKSSQQHHWNRVLGNSLLKPVGSIAIFDLADG